MQHNRMMNMTLVGVTLALAGNAIADSIEPIA